MTTKLVLASTSVALLLLFFALRHGFAEEVRCGQRFEPDEDLDMNSSNAHAINSMLKNSTTSTTNSNQFIRMHDNQQVQRINSSQLNTSSGGSWQNLHTGAKISLSFLLATVLLVAVATMLDSQAGGDQSNANEARKTRPINIEPDKQHQQHFAASTGSQASLRDYRSASLSSSCSSSLVCLSVASSSIPILSADSATTNKKSSKQSGASLTRQLILAFSLKSSASQIFGNISSRPKYNSDEKYQAQGTDSAGQRSRAASLSSVIINNDQQRQQQPNDESASCQRCQNVKYCTGEVPITLQTCTSHHTKSQNSSCVVVNCKQQQKQTKFKLYHQQESIDSLHGIRFLSMIWVIVIHSYNFALRWLFFTNTSTVEDIYKTIASQILANGSFACDSFFFAAGFLLPYLAIPSLAPVAHAPVLINVTSKQQVGAEQHNNHLRRDQAIPASNEDHYHYHQQHQHPQQRQQHHHHHHHHHYHHQPNRRKQHASGCCLPPSPVNETGSGGGSDNNSESSSLSNCGCQSSACCTCQARQIYQMQVGDGQQTTLARASAKNTNEQHQSQKMMTRVMMMTGCACDSVGPNSTSKLKIVNINNNCDDFATQCDCFSSMPPTIRPTSTTTTTHKSRAQLATFEQTSNEEMNEFTRENYNNNNNNIEHNHEADERSDKDDDDDEEDEIGIKIPNSNPISKQVNFGIKFIKTTTTNAANKHTSKQEQGTKQAIGTQLLSFNQVLVNILHRYVRMMPLMMAIIGLSATLLRYLGDGPQWNDSTMMYDKWCRSNWWINLLFVHNFINRENMCLSHSWYSAVDLQLFLLGQLIMFVLFKWRKLGLIMLALCLFGSQIITATLTLLHHLPAVPLVARVSEQTMNQYYGEVYIKPYCRASPYLIGLLLAYLMRTTSLGQMRLNKWQVSLGWLISLTLLTIILLITQPAMNGHSPSDTQSALYSALSRPLWACATGWMVFACMTRQAGIIGKLLGAKCFIPFSRLTYPAFLIHPIVMAVFYGSRQSSFHFSHYLMLYLILGNIVITYACAFVLAALFELPLLSIERILKRRFFSHHHHHHQLHQSHQQHQSQQQQQQPRQASASQQQQQQRHKGQQ